MSILGKVRDLLGRRTSHGGVNALTVDEWAAQQRPPHRHDVPPIPNMVGVRRYHHNTLDEGVDWYYPDWFTYRYLTRFPEDTGVKDVRDTSHHTVVDNPDRQPFTAPLVHN